MSFSEDDDSCDYDKLPYHIDYDDAADTDDTNDPSAEEVIKFATAFADDDDDIVDTDNQDNERTNIYLEQPFDAIRNDDDADDDGRTLPEFKRKREESEQMAALRTFYEDLGDDISLVQADSLENQLSLKYALRVYLSETIGEIRNYNYCKRMREFQIDDSALHEFLDRIQNEHQYIRPNEKLNYYELACVAFLPPVKASPDAENLLTKYANIHELDKHNRINKYLQLPITDNNMYFRYCLGLQSTAYNFFDLQKNNPHIYFNLEGAFALTKQKLLKPNPVECLNKGQRNAFKEIMDFFNKPFPEKIKTTTAVASSSETNKQTSKTGDQLLNIGDILSAMVKENLLQQQQPQSQQQPPVSADSAESLGMTIKEEPIETVKIKTEPIDESTAATDATIIKPIFLKRNLQPPKYTPKKSKSSTSTSTLNIPDCPFANGVTHSAITPASLCNATAAMASTRATCAATGTTVAATAAATAATKMPKSVLQTATHFQHDPDADYDAQPSIVEVYLIKGSAGTGKTFILNAVNENAPVFYTTIKGSLVQYAGLNCDAHGATFCKILCTLFNMNFYQVRYMQDVIEKLPFHIIDDLVSKINFSTYPFSTVLVRKKLCLFVDEYSMLSAPLFYFFFKCLKNLYAHKSKASKLLILLVGDPNQIKPIKSIYLENSIKMESLCTKVLELTESKRMVDPQYVKLLKNILCSDYANKHLMQSFLYREFPSICNASTQMEYTIPLEVYDTYPFNFKTDKGIIKDMSFEKLVTFTPQTWQQKMEAEIARKEAAAAAATTSYKRTKKATKKLSNSNEIASKDMQYNIQSNNLDLLLSTPNQMCLSTSGKMLKLREKQVRSFLYPHKTKHLDKVLQWWISNKSNFNETIMLSRTNRIVHQTNILVYIKYHKEMTRYLKDKKSKHLIRFSRIYYHDTIYSEWTFIKPNSEDNMYILPLIVGLKYILLTTIDNLRNGDEIYLVGFVDKPKAGLLMVTETNQLFILFPTSFEMRLFKNETLFGFPICMAAASNIFNSQGKTMLQSDIYIDIQGCNQSEVFVALSRPKELRQIKAILY